jgi:hypothetical protein
VPSGTRYRLRYQGVTIDMSPIQWKILLNGLDLNKKTKPPSQSIKGLLDKGLVRKVKNLIEATSKGKKITELIKERIKTTRRK